MGLIERQIRVLSRVCVLLVFVIVTKQRWTKLEIVFESVGGRTCSARL